MEVRFLEKGHIYESDPPIAWTSVTKLIEKYKEPFDEIYWARKCSKNERSRWYTMLPSKIISLWEQENTRSTDCGSWYHKMMEDKAFAAGGKLYKGTWLDTKPYQIRDGKKIAPIQELTPGIYPEHLTYNEDIGLCGQSDLVYYTQDNFIDIEDYKTNKKIEQEGFLDARLLHPLNHIPDSNYWHYTLQLSIYMKLILIKNPKCKPGRLRIYHVEFEQVGRDKYDFPILQRTDDGGYSPAKGKWYTLPYLEKEVNCILNL